jgi:hypothetical protein
VHFTFAGKREIDGAEKACLSFDPIGHAVGGEANVLLSVRSKEVISQCVLEVASHGD